MGLRDIIIYGNPLLRQKSAPVARLTPQLERLAADMAETMYENKGVGLAAPQAGQLVRLIVVDVEQCKDDKDNPDNRRLLVFYNPEVAGESDEDAMQDEGCLSFPGVRGDVYRPARVKFRALDGKFKPVEFEADGLLARALQHEIDHLNGVFFIDRISRIKRVALTARLARLRKLGQAQARGEKIVIEKPAVPEAI